MKRKLKILYIRCVYWFNLKAGGSVAHTAGIINSLARKTDLTVISNDHLAGVKVGYKIIRPVLIKFLPLKINEMLYSLKLVRTLKNFAEKFDAIYQRYSGASFAGALLSKMTRKIFILEFNSSEYWSLKHWNLIPRSFKERLFVLFNKYILRPIILLNEKINLKCADIITVVSDVLRLNLIRMGVNKEKIIVIPNGVDPSKFDYRIRADDLRKKLGLEGKTVVGFIGTFGHWHGILELGKAIIMFYEKHPEFIESTRFLLIGDGILGDKVRNLIRNSDYADNVIFTGIVPQQLAPKYLSLCDIFVSPTLHNPDGTPFFGSPTKLFEYMAMKRPIIASKVGQIGQILKHNESAWLVEPGNVEMLADAIYMLIKDSELRKKLADNSYRLVTSKYTWDRLVDKLLKKTHELVHK